MIGTRSRLCTLLVVCALWVAMTDGQSSTATIFGNVLDSSGAAVSGAEVTATNIETGFSRTVKAGGEGEYNIPFLPVGTYTVEIKAQGFQSFKNNNIELTLGRKARVDATLKVGAAIEQINVNADAAQINLLDASIGRTVDNKEILTLPLVNRDPYSFLSLTPGVQSNSNVNALGYPQQVVLINGSSQDRMAGNLGSSVGFYLDGGANNGGLRSTGNISPNPDAVQEFRVATNGYTAEYGRYSGGVVDMITKSGTNRIHGSLFEFLRNDKMNATPWNVATKPPLHRNQFGATLGGPIRKDKIFYFGSYSGLRQRQSSVLPQATVPTALERAGDFSQSAVKPINPATNARYLGDIIPIDPVSKKILDQYIPVATLPNNRYQATLPNPTDTDELIGKIDYALTSKHQLAGSIFWAKGKQVEPVSGGGAASIPWSSRTFSWKQYNITVGDTWTYSPTVVNQLRVNWVRNFGGRLNVPTMSLTDLGSRFVIQGPASLPRITVNGFFTLGEAISGPVAGSNFYGLRDTVSWNLGKHSLRFGGEASLEKEVQNTTLDNYGTFTFDGSRACQRASINPAGACSNSSRNGLADFLLGFPQRMTQDAPVNKIDNNWYYALFLQDDFRIRPTFTLNLGLRWDVQLPTLDPHDRKLTYIAGRTSTLVPSAPAGLVFAGDPGVGRGIVDTRMMHFAPRLGFAWDPFGQGKTAIRGGFGMFWGSISGNEWNQSADRLPFSVRQTFTSVRTISDPYTTITGVPNSGVSPFPYIYDPKNPKFILPAAVAGPDLDYEWPYTYQMNLSFQQQLSPTTAITLAYVGSLSHNLAFNEDINYATPRSSPTDTRTVDQRRPILAGTLSNIFIMRSLGKDFYHSLQVSVDKRLSNHFSLKGHYTWSRDIETLSSGAQNMKDLAAEKARSENDRRHNGVLSLIWDLSYFPKNSFMTHILNGWTVSSILNLQSGGPINITSGADNNADGDSGTDRPNLIADPYTPGPVAANNDAGCRAGGSFFPTALDQRTWFNPCAFQKNAANTNGTLRRNFLQGPGYKNVDIGILRDFKIMERMNLQFRAEMTNAFNMVSRSNPAGGLSNLATAGRITSARSNPRQVQLGLRLTF